MSDPYNEERRERDLKRLLDPSHWPESIYGKAFCLKRYTNEGRLEHARLEFDMNKGQYTFFPEWENTKRQEGGEWLPKWLIKEGWVSD